MYKTVSECKARLAEIDSVLAKLEREKALLLLEQGFIKNAMSFAAGWRDESDREFA